MNTNNTTLTAITGGIGAGKSVVSRILRVLGYTVYDCDSRAKALMDADEEIKQRIVREIDSLAVDRSGRIDRRRLAATVFADAEKLAALNAIVHTAVKLDIDAQVRASSAVRFFVETAILYQSGLNETVTDEWRVTAPIETRIARVMERNAMARAEVEARIASQAFTPGTEMRVPPVSEIVNDGLRAILPQIFSLLNQHPHKC